HVGANIHSPTVSDPAEIEGVRCGVHPGNLSPNTGNLNVTFFSSQTSVEADVRPLELGSDARKFDTAGINSLIARGTGTFEGDHDIAVALRHWNPANLHVAIEDHAVRTPVFDRIRKHIDVHERTPSLACSEVSQFTVSVAQAEGRLAGVDSHTEELKFENGLEV